MPLIPPCQCGFERTIAIRITSNFEINPASHHPLPSACCANMPMRFADSSFFAGKGFPLDIHHTKLACHKMVIGSKYDQVLIIINRRQELSKFSL